VCAIAPLRLALIRGVANPQTPLNTASRASGSSTVDGNPITRPCGAEGSSRTSSSGRDTGIERSITPSINANTVRFAPIATARIATADAVNHVDFRSMRAAYPASLRTESHDARRPRSW
jgi:hypothetical protein